MKLQDFVAETLTQIVNGVATAQDDAGHGAKINPDGLTVTEAGKPVLRRTGSGTIVQEIEFDVAVTVVEDSKTKGGVGLVVGPIALGSQGESGNVNQFVTTSCETPFKVTLRDLAALARFAQTVTGPAPLCWASEL